MKTFQVIINVKVTGNETPKFDLSASEVLDGFDLYRVDKNGNPAQDDYIVTYAEIVSVTEVGK